ncbi:MAG: alcohol dehydrogenase, partial [Bdellovibrio sp.]
MNVRKFVTPEILFGVKSRQYVGAMAKKFGAARVLLVTDPGLIKAGWTGEVLQLLQQAAVECHVYSQVTPNPRVEEIMAGAETFKEKNCDIIVTVGGGSVTDCAKGIGIIASNGG